MKSSIEKDLLEFTTHLEVSGEKVHLQKLNVGVNVGPQIEAYGATLVISGTPSHGYGVDLSYPTAVVKSVAELFERCLLRYQSNIHCAAGLAVHQTIQEAAKHASFEIIERDLFMCYYLTKKKMLDITERAYSISSVFSLARKQLLASGADLRIGLMHWSDMMSCIFCVCFNPTESLGCIVGAACKSTLEQAIDKSVLDVLGNVAYVRRNKVEAISAEEFFARKSPTLDDHFRIALHPLSSDIVRSRLGPDGIFQNDEGKYFDSMMIDDVIIPAWLADLPLASCRASNPDVQPMRFGFISEKNINIERMKHFAGHDLAFCDLETHPHPFH